MLPQHPSLRAFVLCCRIVHIAAADRYTNFGIGIKAGDVNEISEH